VTAEAVGRRLASHPSKVRRVYNGVDLARFNPGPSPRGLRRSLQVPEEVPVILSVGRFVAYKGYEHLLEAAKIVHGTRPDVQWILVGDGELKSQLQKQCHDLGLEDIVHFTGWREDIADLLATSSLFVLPSLGEHFGRVLIEAMAMAKPVVATNAGGVPEIVTDRETGLLVPPAQPGQLAECVRVILHDPALARRMGAAGRQRAEQVFSLTQHARSMEAVYTDCAGATNGQL
jgi:glycosyltransferase involved in cell wall biosynthesis